MYSSDNNKLNLLPCYSPHCSSDYYSLCPQCLGHACTRHVSHSKALYNIGQLANMVQLLAAMKLAGGVWKKVCRKMHKLAQLSYPKILKDIIIGLGGV